MHTVFYTIVRSYSLLWWICQIILLNNDSDDHIFCRQTVNLLGPQDYSKSQIYINILWDI